MAARSVASHRIFSSLAFLSSLKNPNALCRRRSSPPTNSMLLLLFFLLVLSSSPPPVVTSQPLGLDSYLSSLFVRDRHGDNDSFLHLPSHLKLLLSSPSPHPPSLLRDLPTSVSFDVHLHIRLVGSTFTSHASSTLLSYLNAAHSSSHFHVTIGGGPDHHLSPSHALRPDAALSPSQLLSSLSEALQSHISSTPSPILRSSLHPVPYHLIDRLVADDYRKESSRNPPGYFLYLLDLGPPPKPYAYSYDGLASSTPSPAFSRCLGSMWTASDRYMWIDLSAGPVDYGPALAGEGLIPRGEFHPLAAFHSKDPRPESSIMTDLASLALGAYRALLVPPLRIPVFLEASLLVRFIHIHGSDPTDPKGLDLHSLEETLQNSGLTIGDQSLKFETRSVRYTDCSICSFAIAKSTHSFTSRFLFDNYTLIVSEYLDSKRLHQVLTSSAGEINRLSGIVSDDEDDSSGRVLPVYIFDLDYDRVLLLDRFHMSVAFRNMVIAVRTMSAQTVSDYSCNGRHVITQTRELDRPILGSILQSMWGVSPTHLSWSPHHNDTLVDYTWSVGQNPFGPFAETASLSFVQKDAAKRNVLLYSLNLTVMNSIDVLSSMVSYGGDRKLLLGSKHTEFVQRWNLMWYKLERTMSAMSHLDFEKAAFYLRLSDHDLFAIHDLVYQACGDLEASLVCFKDPPFPWATAFVSVVILVAFVCVYKGREKLFKNKRKRF